MGEKVETGITIAQTEEVVMEIMDDKICTNGDFMGYLYHTKKKTYRIMAGGKMNLTRWKDRENETLEVLSGKKDLMTSMCGRIHSDYEEYLEDLFMTAQYDKVDSFCYDKISSEFCKPIGDYDFWEIYGSYSIHDKESDDDNPDKHRP